MEAVCRIPSIITRAGVSSLYTRISSLIMQRNTSLDIIVWECQSHRFTHLWDVAKVRNYILLALKHPVRISGVISNFCYVLFLKVLFPAVSLPLLQRHYVPWQDLRLMQHVTYDLSYMLGHRMLDACVALTPQGLEFDIKYGAEVSYLYYSWELWCPVDTTILVTVDSVHSYRNIHTNVPRHCIRNFYFFSC